MIEIFKNIFRNLYQIFWHDFFKKLPKNKSIDENDSATFLAKYLRSRTSSKIKININEISISQMLTKKPQNSIFVNKCK
jgi:hypothetical protein